MPNGSMKIEMQALGARLAVLVAAADIPEDQKEAWLTLLTDMTFEQIGKFMMFLVTKLPASAMEEFTQFESDVKRLQSEHETRVNAANAKADDALKAIEKQLEQP